MFSCFQEIFSRNLQFILSLMASNSAECRDKQSVDWEEFYLLNKPPLHYEDYHKKINEFCSKFRDGSTRIALVTVSLKFISLGNR